MKKSILYLVMTIFVIGVQLSCREDKSAAEKVEDGIEEVGEGLEEGAEEIGDEMEEAGEEIEDEVDDATDDN